MSRKVIQIGEEDINALILEVKEAFGHPIQNKSHIIHLIDKITTNNSKDIISFNTLRRFFKLIPSQHTPTIETLNILCRFCGYASWEEFTYVINQNSENFLGHSMIQIIRKQWSKEKAKHIIQDFKKSEKLYFWMSSVFHQISLEDKVFLVKESLNIIQSPQNENTSLGYAQYFWVQTIGCYMMQLEKRELTIFMKQIHHLKVICELCVSYNPSEINYDLILSHCKNDFTSTQDKLFLLSIQTLREYLKFGKLKKTSIVKIHQLVISADQFDIKPFSRIKALQIISEDAIHGSIERLKKDMSYFQKNKYYRESVVFFVLEISRALCHKNRFKDALQIISHYSNTYRGNVGFWASIHRNTLHLYSAWSNYFAGNKKSSIESLKNFNPQLVENFQEEWVLQDLKLIKKLLAEA